MSDLNRLEQLLVKVGRDLEMPPTPAIAATVRARLERERVTPVERTWRSWGLGLKTAPSYRLVGAAAAVVILLAGTLIGFSPSAREAIADFIGIGGVRISAPDEVPTPPAGSGLDLGERVSLAEAEASIGFDVRLPTLAAYAQPDVVYFDPRTPGRVTLVYEATPDLPAAAGRVGMLITQFDPGSRRLVAEKLLGPGTGVRLVDVDGSPGYWISGEPHVFFYVGKGGDSFEETPRLAANVLFWETADGLTVRIESELSLRESLEIARSLS